MLNVLELVRYLVTILCLVAAGAANYPVIAFGYVAVAVAVMLGPVSSHLYRARYGMDVLGMAKALTHNPSTLLLPTHTYLFLATSLSISSTGIHPHTTGHGLPFCSFHSYCCWWPLLTEY